MQSDIEPLGGTSDGVAARGFVNGEGPAPLM